MAKYHLTIKAVQDLDAIWAYTLKTWSEKQADEYYSSLVETFAAIAKRPCHLDKEYVEIHPGLYDAWVNIISHEYTQNKRNPKNFPVPFLCGQTS